MEKTLCFIIDNQNLYLDQNIISLDIPLLFVCKDEQENRYLSLCTDSNELHYLITKITTDTLLALLKSEITLRAPFSKSNQIWKIISENNISEDQVIPICYSQIPDIDLPEKNAYLDYSNEELLAYQSILENDESLITLYILEKKIKSINLYHTKLTFKNIVNKRQNSLDDMIATIDIPFKHVFSKNKGGEMIWLN